MNNLTQILRAKGVSSSYQRIKILQYLINNRIHPSVEKIYNDLVGDIPTLSKTTVYNTLSLLREKGLITIVPDEVEVKFDADITPHGHFKCSVCHEIYDFTLDRLEYDEEKLKNFTIIEKHIYFIGVCAKCNALKDLNKKGE